MQVVSRDDRETHEALEGAFLTQLAVGEEMSVQHFAVEPGAGAPEHSHPHEQAGFLLQGSMIIVVDGEEHAIEAGDSYIVPGGVPHAVWATGVERMVGIEIFSPPRPTPPWLE